MTWFLRIGVALLLTVGLVGNAFAAPGDGQTAATAIALPASLSASGSVAGSTVGGFTFYTFDNPSAGTTGLFSISFTPTDSSAANAFGVNLYHNGARLLAMNGVGPQPGSKASDFSTAVAGPILVQIYNYLPGSVTSYSFAISGIFPPDQMVVVPTATPVPPSGSTPANPVVQPSSLDVTGTQKGDITGAYTYYSFTYPGNGKVGTVTLSVTPSDSNWTNGVGVNLYLEGANVLSMNARGPIAGSNTGTFSSMTGGTVLLQVYNYQRYITFSYHLVVSGLTP